MVWQRIINDVIGSIVAKDDKEAGLMMNGYEQIHLDLELSERYDSWVCWQNFFINSILINSKNLIDKPGDYLW